MQKLTKEEFINKSKIIFGDILDYSKVNYINSRNKIILICKKHNIEFLINAKDHLCYKRACQLCSEIRINKDIFIQKAIRVHGNKYNYNNVQNNIENIYLDIKTIKVPITCLIHNENFLQTPDSHVNRKAGCPKCDKYAYKDLKYVIDTATKIHNGIYNYSLVEFTKMNNKIKIICKQHGIFEQTATNHITYKQDCPKCMVAKSKKEKLWLDYLNIPNNKDHRTVYLYINKTKFIADGYDPKTNTVYEFYGDFWHGNPNKYDQNKINVKLNTTFKELYDKTIKREELLIKNGYTIVKIWESDFDKLKLI